MTEKGIRVCIAESSKKVFTKDWALGAENGYAFTDQQLAERDEKLLVDFLVWTVNQDDNKEVQAAVKSLEKDEEIASVLARIYQAQKATKKGGQDG